MNRSTLSVLALTLVGALIFFVPAQVRGDSDDASSPTLVAEYTVPCDLSGYINAWRELVPKDHFRSTPADIVSTYSGVDEFEEIVEFFERWTLDAAIRAVYEYPLTSQESDNLVLAALQLQIDWRHLSSQALDTAEPNVDYYLDEITRVGQKLEKAKSLALCVLYESQLTDIAAQKLERLGANLPRIRCIHWLGKQISDLSGKTVPHQLQLVKDEARQSYSRYALERRLSQNFHLGFFSDDQEIMSELEDRKLAGAPLTKTLFANIVQELYTQVGDDVKASFHEAYWPEESIQRLRLLWPGFSIASLGPIITTGNVKGGDFEITAPAMVMKSPCGATWLESFSVVIRNHGAGAFEILYLGDAHGYASQSITEIRRLELRVSEYYARKALEELGE